MYQDYELSVSPGTTAASPTEYIKSFIPCTIDELVVTFPKGPNREVYVKVYHEVESVFPFDPEEWINGEDEEVTVKGPWSNWDGLYQLRIKMCSPGARLSHKVIFRFNLSEYQPPDALQLAANQLIGTSLPIPVEWS